MSEEIAIEKSLVRLAGTILHQMPTDLSADIVKEWQGDPEALGEFLLGLHDGPYPIAKIKTRELVVTIYPKRTVEEWVEAGKYDYRNPNLTTANFGRFLTVNKDAAEPYKAKVVAFCLGRRATIEKAKRVRARLNLKPIGLEHEAAVGEQHSELQREFHWLVNLDAVWAVPGGRRCLSYLYGDPDGRRFGLSGAGHEWDDNTWFFGLSQSLHSLPATNGRV